MRTHLCKGLAFIVFAGLFMTGCKTETKRGQKNDVSFTSIKVEEAYHLLENAENPNCDLQLDFTYPVKFADAEVLAKIQRLFIFSYFGENYESLAPQEAVDRYVKDYLQMYRELEEDYKEDLKNADSTPVGAWYNYYEMSSNEVVFNADNLISYVVSYENFTGGAHGAHSVTNHVIDLSTGELLKEEDIFVQNFERLLAQMLIEAIAEKNGLEDPKELESIGYFSIEEIYPNGNFLVDDTGITYTFNEYEIAAYAVGMTSVHFPFDRIRHLLRPESPISILL